MGYIGRSMSVNASEAYEEGRKPFSSITKEDISAHGVTEALSFFKWYVSEYCSTGEWHHTSYKYNRTFFYDIEKCCTQFKEADIDELRAEYKAHQSDKKAEKEPDEPPYYAKIHYSESAYKGPRRHYDTYAIVYKGWAYCYHIVRENTDGTFVVETRKKNTNGLHIEIEEKYHARPEEMPEAAASAIFSKYKIQAF